MPTAALNVSAPPTDPQAAPVQYWFDVSSWIETASDATPEFTPAPPVVSAAVPLSVPV